MPERSLRWSRPISEKRRFLQQVLDPLAAEDPSLARIATGDFVPSPDNPYFFGKAVEPLLDAAEEAAAEESEALANEVIRTLMTELGATPLYVGGVDLEPKASEKHDD